MSDHLIFSFKALTPFRTGARLHWAIVGPDLRVNVLMGALLTEKKIVSIESIKI